MSVMVGIAHLPTNRCVPRHFNSYIVSVLAENRSETCSARLGEHIADDCIAVLILLVGQLFDT